MNVFKGLTWDHPRGYRPLQAWAGADTSLDLEWHIQKLEGFESHPIDELAAQYDLLVVDNPGIGEAVEKECLRPLQEYLTAEQLAFLEKSSIGASFRSYEYRKKNWAVPIDGAAQVCALVRQEIGQEPVTWQDVISLSQTHQGRIALSLGGPHALITFYSICQSLGGSLFCHSGDIVKRTVAVQAVNIMKEIYRHQKKDLVNLNPITLLDEMARGTFALCPAIFGYVNYAVPKEGAAIDFVNIPHCGNETLRGSVLGGTGLALSIRCEPSPALIEHIMGYVSDKTQRTVVVEHGGQPVNANAWRDQEVNRLTHDFFRNTYDTVSQAYVRPKHHGYIAFQDSSSSLIRDGLVANKAADRIVDAMVESYSRYSPT